MIGKNKKGREIKMNIIGVNSILKLCQVSSKGRKYSCPTKWINGELFFAFKKQWHSVAQHATEYTTELIKEGGKVFSRKYL